MLFKNAGTPQRQIPIPVDTPRTRAAKRGSDCDDVTKDTTLIDTTHNSDNKIKIASVTLMKYHEEIPVKSTTTYSNNFCGSELLIASRLRICDIQTSAHFSSLGGNPL